MQQLPLIGIPDISPTTVEVVYEATATATA
jgi:hypothetical protein